MLSEFGRYRFSFSDIRRLRSGLAGERFDNIDPSLANAGRRAEKDLRAALSNGERPGASSEFVLAQVSPGKRRMEGVLEGLGVTVATEADIVSYGRTMVDYRGAPSTLMRIIEVKNRRAIYPMDIFQALWMLTVARVDNGVQQEQLEAVDCAVYCVQGDRYLIVDDLNRETHSDAIYLLVSLARILAEKKTLKREGKRHYEVEFLEKFNMFLNQLAYELPTT